MFRLEEFLDVAEGLLLRSRVLPLRTRWARPQQLEAEAKEASGGAPRGPDAATRFLHELSQRRQRQQVLRDRAQEEAEVSAVLASIPFREGVSPKVIEAERKAKLTALGFQEVVEQATPWRLDPNPQPGGETPDLWAAAMESEARTWVRLTPTMLVCCCCCCYFAAASAAVS